MRMIPLIIAAAALLALAACTQSSPAPSSALRVSYTTYGGFIAPSHAITTTTIVGRNVTVVTTSSNGTVTEQSSYTTSQANADALAMAINASRFPALPARIPAQHPVPVADVGSANLTISQGTASQTVVIELNWADAMPHDISRIVSAIQNVTQDKPRPAHDMTLAYEPVQCNQTPWQSWYANGSQQYVTKPTDTQLITDYYGSKGLSLRNVRAVQRSGMVCQACGVCVTQTYFTASVNSTNEQQLRSLGWGDVPTPSNGGSNGGVMMVPVQYAPKQCEQTPWDSWYGNGSVQFIKAPTVPELITAYYSSTGLSVSNVARVNRTEMVCQACGVCDAPYYITASVANADLAKLQAQGWVPQGSPNDALPPQPGSSPSNPIKA